MDKQLYEHFFPTDKEFRRLEECEIQISNMMTSCLHKKWNYQKQEQQRRVGQGPLFPSNGAPKWGCRYPSSPALPGWNQPSCDGESTSSFHHAVLFQSPAAFHKISSAVLSLAWGSSSGKSTRTQSLLWNPNRKTPFSSISFHTLPVLSWAWFCELPNSNKPLQYKTNIQCEE